MDFILAEVGLIGLGVGLGGAGENICGGDEGGFVKA